MNATDPTTNDIARTLAEALLTEAIRYGRSEISEVSDPENSAFDVFLPSGGVLRVTVGRYQSDGSRSIYPSDEEIDRAERDGIDLLLA